MPGFFSGLTHAAARGVIGYGEGEEEQNRALLKRLADQRAQRRQDLADENIRSEIAARDYAAAHRATPEYHPATREEATSFYKDTHPQKDTGPVPGSEAWFNMQARVAQDRARYRTGAAGGGGGRRDDLIPLDKEITTIGQEIDDNRQNLNVHDRDFKSQFPEGAPERRPKTPAMVPGFISDSTRAQGMLGQRRQMMQRDSTLNADRDKVQAVRRKKMGLEMGLSPTTPVAGAGADAKPTGIPPEAQALLDEAAEAYKAAPTPENQVKYNRVVTRIFQKYMPGHITP